MRRATRAFASLILATFASSGVLTACSSASQPHEDTLSPDSSAQTLTTASQSVDPRAAAAVEAYRAFWRAAFNAQRHAVAAGGTYPAAADFARFSFDPARAIYVGYIAGLAAQGVQFRGTPPEPRVRVVSVEPGAKPYPLVMLSDCQTLTSDWNEYVTATGKRVPVASASVPPPYEITAKVVYYKGHWGLQSTTTDTSRTCTG